jgi:putative DNA primase/helicase
MTTPPDSGSKALTVRESTLRLQDAKLEASVYQLPIARPKPAIQSFNLTDLGNAKRLVAHFGNDVRYVPPWKRWLVWDGQRWVFDESGDIHRAAKETVKRIYAEAANADSSGDRKGLADHAKQSEAAGRFDAMIKLAKTEPGIPVMPDELDTAPFLLNVLNGTLDLRTGELRPHRREDFITKLAPVEYDSDAKCPMFMEFLAQITGGDEGLQHFIQRAIGYSLTGDTSEQVLFIPYGTGANGKTTLLNLVHEILDDYALQTPTDTLVRKRERSATNDLARLRGARFVVATEVAEDGRLDEVMVKQVTGGDMVTARFLHKEFFQFRPECKIFLVTNHKPEIRGSDEGIWRRVMLIPFEVRIQEEDRDKHLPEKLRKELPGILAWAVRGCLAWQKDGLAPPEKVRAATADYRAESDWMSAFLEEKCVRKDGAETQAGKLYGAFGTWWPPDEGDDEGDLPTQKQFGRRLRIAGLHNKKKGGIKWWIGVALK